MKRAAAAAAAVCAALLCVLAWNLNRSAFLGAYLAAWWFWTGIAMGGLANVWLHNLTGGAWGEPLRAPLLRMGGCVWIAALLFAPVLIGMQSLYPWVADAARGTARWSGELSAPDFKSLWLMPGFFIARSVAYLLAWVLLAWLSAWPPLQRSKGFSAAALIVYGLSVSGAAIDWVMSLAPLWYSSVFGWLTGTGQMLSGMAAATLVACRAGARLPRAYRLRDLGNLLMMYVMIWAYLNFVQYLIIWAENLPHEIAWYLARARGGWLGMAWLLALGLFCLPFLILLFRRAKDAPRVMLGLCAALLAMKLVEDWWQILPSVRGTAAEWLWMAPLAAAAVPAVFWIALSRTPPPAAPEVEKKEERHA